jgi:hypothetical protein
MRKIFISLLIIVVIFGIYHYADQYIRFHAPSNYDYKLNDSIDKQYHDANFVLKYHQKTQEVGNIARNAWFEHKVDVLMHNQNAPESKSYIRDYQVAKAEAWLMERKLIQSAKLKKLGLSNAEIKMAEEEGVSGEQGRNWMLAKAAAKILNGGTLKMGDNNWTVYFVQDLLRKKGFKIPLDGYFETRTKDAVLAFQKEKELLATGIVNDLLIVKLME